MGKVIAGFSMSLDGFIAGPNDDVQQVFAWMSRGNLDRKMSTGEHDIDLKMSSQSAELFDEIAKATGAIVSGRRLFDVAGAWGGKHPLDVPVIVLTHTVPQEWMDRKDAPFTFVTGGIEAAVQQAQAIAGDKHVGVGGADVTRQCISAGLLDEIQIDLVPILLGDGVRLFDHLGAAPIQLDIIRVVEAPGVTHLRYRIVK